MTRGRDDASLEYLPKVLLEPGPAGPPGHSAPLRSAPLLYAASWLRGNFLCLAGIATETTSVWKSALPASAKALSYEYAGAPDRGPWCGSYPKTWGRRATLAA
jgi:hypothetical protein